MSGGRSFRLRLVWLLLGCFFAATGCVNETSNRVRKAREADVLAVAKVGLKFTDVRAALLEKGYQCPELSRLQTAQGPSSERTASVWLAEGSWQSTFNYSTGHTWIHEPRSVITVWVDDQDVIARIR